MNKKQIVTGILWTALTALIGGKMKDHIMGLVKAQLGSSAEGPDKKRAVMEQLSLVKDDLLEVVQKVGGYIISMAVDIAVGYLKSRMEDQK